MYEIYFDSSLQGWKNKCLRVNNQVINPYYIVYTADVPMSDCESCSKILGKLELNVVKVDALGTLNVYKQNTSFSTHKVHVS